MEVLIDQFSREPPVYAKPTSPPVSTPSPIAANGSLSPSRPTPPPRPYPVSDPSLRPPTRSPPPTVPHYSHAPQNASVFQKSSSNSFSSGDPLRCITHLGLPSRKHHPSIPPPPPMRHRRHIHIHMYVVPQPHITLYLLRKGPPIIPSGLNSQLTSQYIPLVHRHPPYHYHNSLRQQESYLLDPLIRPLSLPVCPQFPRPRHAITSTKTSKTRSPHHPHHPTLPRGRPTLKFFTCTRRYTPNSPQNVQP